MMGVRARFIIMCVWGVEGVMKWRPVGEEVEAGEEKVMVKNDLAGRGRGKEISTRSRPQCF